MKNPDAAPLIHPARVSALEVLSARPPLTVVLLETPAAPAEALEAGRRGIYTLPHYDLGGLHEGGPGGF